MIRKERNQYNVLILEDKLKTQKNIQEIVTRLGYHVSGVAASYEEAIESANDMFPHIALCDIDIYGYRDGIEVAKFLSEKGNLSIVYLTVATSQEVINKAFEVKPAGYLLKSSLNQDMLDIQLQIAITNLENKTHDESVVFDGQIGIWNRGRCYRISLDSILYVEADNNDCIIVTNEEIREVNQRFGDVVKQLAGHGIKQVHRSYAVNMKKIQVFDKGPTQLELDYRNLAKDLKSEARKYITVSDKYRRELREKYGMG